MAKWTWTQTIPKWKQMDRLWPTVPWLADSDFDEGRRAIWDLDFKVGEDKGNCWAVKLYEQSSTKTMYVLMHATRGNGNDGGEIKLSLSDTPRFDIYARDTFAMQPVQSNPARRRYRDDVVGNFDEGDVA
jgi:hypothetical protein